MLSAYQPIFIGLIGVYYTKNALSHREANSSILYIILTPFSKNITRSFC